MIRGETDDLVKDTLLISTEAPDVPRLRSVEAHKNIRRAFELVSDLFQEGNCIVVQVIGGNDPTMRTLQLPVSILLGLSDRHGQKQSLARDSGSFVWQLATKGGRKQEA